MNKLQKKSNKRNVLIVVLLVVVLYVGLFFLLNGPERVRRAYGGAKVRVAYVKAFRPIDTPLQYFGISSLEIDSRCEREEVYGYAGTSLLCVASRQQYTVIGKDAATKEAFVEAAKELDAALKENGWTTFSNTAKSYEEWMKAVTSGVDYNTGIGAHTNTVDGRCGIEMTVAYSNPAPPAINTVLVCNSPAYGSPDSGDLFFISDGDA